MTIDALGGVLLIPAVAAAVLAVLPGYRMTARLNVAAALLTFLTAVSLFFVQPKSGNYLLVDDLNKVFIVLTTFVGFTTSAFSASYIGHEIEIGRLTPTFVRFYHAMYQVLMFAMNLALVANNIGLMWVAIEFATLTTVLMVGIYRTHEALEAAWKYFILGSVGIALALFGTILVYMAALPVLGEGTRPWCGPCWSPMRRNSTLLCSMSPSCSCCSATAPKSALPRCTPGCRTRMRRARRRYRRYCPACCSTSRFTLCCDSRCCWPQTRMPSRQGR